MTGCDRLHYGSGTDVLKGTAATDAGRQKQTTVELPALTSLRGIAALTVVLFHSAYIAVHYGGGGPPTVFARGYLAVDLFFFLSGFVLTHVYLGRLAGGPDSRMLGAFLWARFCRIYPACLFVTSIYVLLYTLGSLTFPVSVDFGAQLAASLLLMQVPWLHEIWINGPSWSISAECYAYLLFPFVVPLVFKLRPATATLLGVSLLSAVGVARSILSAGGQVEGWGALIRALPEFAVGIFAYRSYGEGLLRYFWRRDVAFIVVVALIGLAPWTNLSDGVVVILLPALLLAAVSNTGRIAGLLNARPLRWLGDVSYSVYIFQMVVFMLVVRFAGLLVALGVRGVWFEAVAALSAIGGGVLVHRCIDVPARAALRGLPDRLAGVVAARRAAPTLDVAD